VALAQIESAQERPDGVDECSGAAWIERLVRASKLHHPGDPEPIA
jgi:hypothetical protein